MFETSPKKFKIFKGVSSWFLAKNRPLSHVHFFGKSSHQRSFFDILDRKECFLDRNSEVWKKCKKSKIYKGVSPWFLSKNGRFFHSGFLGKSSHKRLFFDLLNRKECFLDRNSEVWKRCKKSKICKGVSPYLLSKIARFLICVVLGNLATKDRSLIFWIEKNAF